jgi:biotin transport system permease protein
MAEALIFHYRDQDRFLNHVHPLIKFIATISICIALFLVSSLGIVVVTAALVVVSIVHRLPLLAYRRELRFFAVMIILIAITEYFASSEWVAAAVASLRFLSIILCGLLLTDTTAADDLARALGSLLNRIPRINGWRVAAAVELTLSLLPMIFDASVEVTTARKARMERFGNPLRVLYGVASSILSLLLDKIQDFSWALDARGYQPDQVRQRLSYSCRDPLVLLFLAVLLTVASVV